MGMSLISLILHLTLREPVLRRARTMSSGYGPLGTILLPSTDYRDSLLQVSPKRGRTLKARLEQSLQHSFPFSFSESYISVYARTPNYKSFLLRYAILQFSWSVL